LPRNGRQYVVGTLDRELAAEFGLIARHFGFAAFGGAPGFEVFFARDAERASGLAALFAGEEGAARSDGRVLVAGAHEAHDLLDVGVPALRAKVSKEIALGIEFCFARQAKVAVRVRVKGVIDFPLAAA
jgi:hypothetical protein